MHTIGEQERALPRRGRVSISEFVRKRGIPIVPYCVAEIRGLSKMSYKVDVQLRTPYVLPPSLNLERLWYSGSSVRNADHPQPNWSAFMQRICKGGHPPVANIIMLPINDLNLSDETCIYSTFLFLQRQVKLLHMVTRCSTFDQPFYIKAVDINSSALLGIVCRLVGFHMLMNFIRSLMNGSSLVGATEISYDQNAFQHMITGESIARAIRGHFLVVAALAMKMMRSVMPTLACKSSEASTSVLSMLVLVTQLLASG